MASKEASAQESLATARDEASSLQRIVEAQRETIAGLEADKKGERDRRRDGGGEAYVCATRPGESTRKQDCLSPFLRLGPALSSRSGERWAHYTKLIIKQHSNITQQRHFT